jgi:hypothetical protein
VPKGGFYQSFGADFAVFRQNVFFQGTAVHADADGNVVQAAGIRHRLYPVLSTDVAWVNAYLICPSGYCL